MTSTGLKPPLIIPSNHDPSPHPPKDRSSHGKAFFTLAFTNVCSPLKKKARTQDPIHSEVYHFQRLPDRLFVLFVPGLLPHVKNAASHPPRLMRKCYRSDACIIMCRVIFLQNKTKTKSKTKPSRLHRLSFWKNKVFFSDVFS